MASAPATSRIQLVGGGGHALVVLDAAVAAGFKVVSFWDDNPSALLRAHLPYAGTIPELAEGESDVALIVAIGGIASRRHVLGMLNARVFATVIHPRAVVSPSAVIARGTVICAGAVVNPLASIGAHGIVNTGAIVEHECVVGENVHLGPRSVLGGGAGVGADTLIGLGGVVLPQMRIGERCIIGAGAVVTQHIPDKATAIGIPARPRASRGS